MMKTSYATVILKISERILIYLNETVIIFYTVMSDVLLTVLQWNLQWSEISEALRQKLVILNLIEKRLITLKLK